MVVVGKGGQVIGRGGAGPKGSFLFNSVKDSGTAPKLNEVLLFCFVLRKIIFMTNSLFLN